MPTIINFNDYANRSKKVHNEGFLDDDDDEDSKEELQVVDESDEVAVRVARRRSILRGILIGAGVFLIVLVILLQSGTRKYNSANYSKIADIPSQEGTVYLDLGGRIVSYSHDGAGCMDTKGNQIWNVTFEMQQPVVAHSGDVIAIGDYNGSTIHILGADAILGKVDTNLPIRGIAVAENGEIAAVLADLDVTWIYLFNTKGETLVRFKTTMNQSGYPLAVAISPNGQLVAVSHLTIGTQSINTSVAFYNFGDVGQNTVEHNVSGFNYDDEVFPFVTYMNGSTAAAVSDKRLVFYNGNEIPQSGSTAMFSDRIEGVYSNKKYIGVLFPDTSGTEKYAMRIYNADGSLVGTVAFSMDFTKIQLSGDRVVINNDNELLICNVDGTVRYQGAIDVPVRAVIPSESSTSRLTLVTETDIEQMSLE